jgi:hypothetical protein
MSGHSTTRHPSESWGRSNLGFALLWETPAFAGVTPEERQQRPSLSHPALLRIFRDNLRPVRFIDNPDAQFRRFF